MGFWCVIYYILRGRDSLQNGKFFTQFIRNALRMLIKIFGSEIGQLVILKAVIESCQHYRIFEISSTQQFAKTLFVSLSAE